jgi:hypothetical protein
MPKSPMMGLMKKKRRRDLKPRSQERINTPHKPLKEKPKAKKPNRRRSQASESGIHNKT